MSRRFFRVVRRVLIIGIGLLFLTSAGYAYWFTHRERPTPIVSQSLFQGITYTRDILDSPRPIDVHIIEIDLWANGLSFLVTPRNGQDGYEQAARTVSNFADEFGVQVAINGDFFQPFHELGPISYYPPNHGGVNLNGVAISRNRVVSSGDGFAYEAVYISEENQVVFQKPSWDVYNAISGDVLFIQEGEVTISPSLSEYYTKPNPRTAIAINEAGNILWMVVVDGRQPNYSEGATLHELADIMLELGAYTALNMDGGGSSTLVIEGVDGNAKVLNSPIHTHIPGRERPIGNHLGVYALPLADNVANQSVIND